MMPSGTACIQAQITRRWSLTVAAKETGVCQKYRRSSIPPTASNNKPNISAAHLRENRQRNAPHSPRNARIASINQIRCDSGSELASATDNRVLRFPTVGNTYRGGMKRRSAEKQETPCNTKKNEEKKKSLWRSRHSPHYYFYYSMRLRGASTVPVCEEDHGVRSPQEKGCCPAGRGGDKRLQWSVRNCVRGTLLCYKQAGCLGPPRVIPRQPALRDPFDSCRNTL